LIICHNIPPSLNTSYKTKEDEGDNNIIIDIYKRESQLRLNRNIRIPWIFVIETILPVPVCLAHSL